MIINQMMAVIDYSEKVRFENKKIIYSQLNTFISILFIIFSLPLYFVRIKYLLYRQFYYKLFFHFPLFL
jgi:hypothetical protein